MRVSGIGYLADGNLKKNNMEPNYEEILKTEIALGYPGLACFKYREQWRCFCLLCERSIRANTYQDFKNHLLKHSDFFNCPCHGSYPDWEIINSIYYWKPCRGWICDLNYKEILEAELALGYPGLACFEYIKKNRYKCLFCSKIVKSNYFEDWKNHLITHSDFFNCPDLCHTTSLYWKDNEGDIRYWKSCKTKIS